MEPDIDDTHALKFIDPENILSHVYMTRDGTNKIWMIRVINDKISFCDLYFYDQYMALREILVSRKWKCEHFD